MGIDAFEAGGAIARGGQRGAGRLTGLTAIGRALSAGLGAAADCRRFAHMNDGQLAGSGLSRTDVPGELLRRHYR